jgi:hypothetical protein
MTKKEMAIHNRISTKCHAYVKYLFPTEYGKFAAQAASEYASGACRRNSYSDLQKALKPRNPGWDDFETWRDPLKSSASAPEEPAIIKENP